MSTGLGTNEKRMLESKGKSVIKLWYSFLICLIAIGLYAFSVRITGGLITTNLSTAMPWGAWVAFYIYFVGMSAGAFLLSSLIHVFDMDHMEKVGRDATLVAIISMILALLFILVDLGKMARFWHALRYLNITSVLSWEVRFYGLYILLLMAELYFALRYDLVKAAKGTGFKAKLAQICKLGSNNISEESKERDKKILKVLGAIGIPIAIFGVHGGTGLLFAVVKARAYWNTALFPVVFVVSALVSGTALITALYIVRCRVTGEKIDGALVNSLAGWMVLFLLIDVGLQFYEILVGAYGLKEHELLTLKTVFASHFSWSFWGVQLGIGVLLPLILYFYPATRKSATAMFTASIAVVIGILSVRFNIVVPALVVPVLHGLPGGYYYPNFVEWAICTGIISFGLLIYTIAVQLLPITVIKGEGH